MKKIFSCFLLLLFSSLLSFAQTTDSIVVSRWDNHIPKEVKKVLKDSSYEMIKYFSSGNIYSEVYYNKSGKLNGSEKIRYENGALKQESYWKNGATVGKSTMWYISRQKSFECFYSENGAPDGIWKGWYENGQIQYEQNYVNGAKHGKWISYKKDGGAISIQYYEMGILVKEENF